LLPDGALAVVPAVRCRVDLVLHAPRVPGRVVHVSLPSLVRALILRRVVWRPRLCVGRAVRVVCLAGARREDVCERLVPDDVHGRGLCGAWTALGVSHARAPGGARHADAASAAHAVLSLGHRSGRAVRAVLGARCGRAPGSACGASAYRVARGRRRGRFSAQRDLLRAAPRKCEVLASVGWRERELGVEIYQFVTSYSMPPEEVFNTYLPEFTGILDNYFGKNGIHFHSEFIGAAVYLLAFAGFFAAPEGVIRRRVRFWLIVTAVAFLWSLGGATPFFHLIYWLVPGTKFFRAPSAFFFIAGFALAALAGEGVDAMLTRRVSRRYVFVAAGVAAFIAILAVSGALVTFGGTFAPTELYDRVVANASNVTFGAIRALIVVLLVCGAILA